jgi:hypothetical protein
MASDTLDDVEALHRDLESLKENRMPNIDRLAAELEAHVDEFRNLLDQKKRNSESRKKLCSGPSFCSGDCSFTSRLIFLRLTCLRLYRAG